MKKIGQIFKMSQLLKCDYCLKDFSIPQLMFLLTLSNVFIVS